MKTKEKSIKSKKSKAGKIALGIFGGIFGLMAVVVIVGAIVSSVGNKANTEKALSFETVQYEEQLVPEKDENGYYTFTTDRDLRVMQLTDIHIGGGWMSLKKDAMALNAVAAMVTAEKPDLVIVTGDIAYPVPFQAGTFNNLSSARIFAQLMEKLGVYWTLCFGNHDTESYSYYSREDLSEFYSDEDMKYCLYEAGPEDVDGYGNQIINVKNTQGIITQSIYIFDSHSYMGGDVLGVMQNYDSIHENQVQWYKDTLSLYNTQNDKLYESLGKEAKSDIKSTAFFHIPFSEYKDAWFEYMENGHKDTENVRYRFGVMGESGRLIYCSMGEDMLFETMLELGSTQAVFCGHDHENNFSINYKGIDLNYGMSVDYLAYPGIAKLGSQRGCTIINFAPDGSYTHVNENYYQEKYTALYDKEDVTMQEVVHTVPAE